MAPEQQFYDVDDQAQGAVPPSVRPGLLPFALGGVVLFGVVAIAATQFTAKSSAPAPSVEQVGATEVGQELPTHSGANSGNTSNPANEMAKQTKQVAVSSAQMPLEFKASVQFGFDSAVVAPGSLGHLQGLVSQAKRDKGTLTVSGYTDNTGPDTYNKALSRQRADHVVQYLVKQGLPASAIVVHGRGDADPIADNGSLAGRALNRRTEVVFSKNP